MCFQEGRRRLPDIGACPPAEYLRAAGHRPDGVGSPRRPHSRCPSPAPRRSSAVSLSANAAVIAGNTDSAPALPDPRPQLIVEGRTARTHGLAIPRVAGGMTTTPPRRSAARAGTEAIMPDNDRSESRTMTVTSRRAYRTVSVATCTFGSCLTRFRGLTPYQDIYKAGSPSPAASRPTRSPKSWDQTPTRPAPPQSHQSGLRWNTAPIRLTPRAAPPCPMHESWPLGEPPGTQSTV